MNDLKVYILSDSKYSNNVAYFNIFGKNCVYRLPAKPPSDWLSSNTNDTFLTELYNHYLIWKEIVETSKPIAIIYNTTHILQSDYIVEKLCNEASKIKSDIFYIGKYWDSCEKYIKETDVVISSKEDVNTIYTYPVYRTFSPNGAYAYICSVSGAKKLIDNLYKRLLWTNIKNEFGLKDSSYINVSEYMKYQVKNEYLYALTYHPSIIGINTLNDKSKVAYECSDPRSENQKRYWYWFIIVLSIILIIIIVILIVRLSHHIISYSGNNLKFSTIDKIEKFPLMPIIPYGPSTFYKY